MLYESSASPFRKGSKESGGVSHSTSSCTTTNTKTGSYRISRIISGITDQSIENRNILTMFTSSLSSSSSFDSTNSINPSSRVPLLRLQNDIKHLINAIMYILHYKQSLISTYFNVHSISKMEV